jgi:hypothetical protein
LTSRVLPGVLLTRAKRFLRTSLLSKDDFPTFDRPANATSGHFGSGRHPFGLAIGPMNSRLRITSGSRAASANARILEIRAFRDANEKGDLS